MYLQLVANYSTVNSTDFLRCIIKWMNVLPEDQESIPIEKTGKIKIADKRHLNVNPP